MGNPLLVVVNVFCPVPTVIEDFVLLMIRPEPAPCSLIALEILTGRDHVKVPGGNVIVSPFNALSCKACTLACDPSEW
jgi:hypothetical protein